jgi:protein TonB
MKTSANNQPAGLSVLASSLILSVLLGTGCSKNPAPESVAANESETVTSTTEAPTGLVKNPIKLSHTADATKWMDMASTKTAAQIAKEEKIAKEIKDAKDAKEAQAAKLAAEAKDAQVAKLAAEARALAAKAKEIPKMAAAVPAVVAPKPAPVAVHAPAEQLTLKIVSKVQPNYPREAARAGINSGVVSARLQIETDGKVSKVEIMKASPPRQFDREVIAAASQWKYAPISKPLSTMVEFNFKLDNN